MKISDRIFVSDAPNRSMQDIADAINRDRLIGFSVNVRAPKEPECTMNLGGVPHRLVADGQTVNITRLEPEKLSLTGADEVPMCAIHRTLCRLSPIADLAAHHAALATLTPADVDEIVCAIIDPAVQSSDIRGIMAMRAPLPAPEPAIPEAKPSPEGLGTVSGMDHRLGAWKC